MINYELPMELLVVDLETTGTDPMDDRIVEIAGVHLRGDGMEEISHFRSYIQEAKPSSEDAIGIHGLTEEALRDAPPEREVIKAFSDFAPENVILAGHNVGFDVSFLKAAFERNQVPFRFDYHHLDAWSLGFFILGATGKTLPKYNLDHLAGFFGIERPKVHGALSDVRATAEILRRLFEAINKVDLVFLPHINSRGVES